MKTSFVLGFCFMAGTAEMLEAQDFLDQVDDALTVTAFHDDVRARLSGTLDLEIYHYQQPAPGLINSTSTSLFNPRLTFFLDAQLGPRLYFFAQSRIDRGFDPSDRAAQVRLDEYAIRFTPWEDGRFNFQIGKFATVVGNWVGRHLSWDNPFITAPFPYENVTRVSDTIPFAPPDFIAGHPDDKYEFNPIIWGPSYTSGFSVAGRLGKFEYAGELKNSSLSSRPESWDITQIGFDHPTFNGRLGFRPNESWNLGISAGNGAYLRPEAELLERRDIGDFREMVLGQDISFALHHWQLFAEFYEARFEVPGRDNADTFAYYIEGKYKFTPQLFGALRWNQQMFSSVRDGEDNRELWGTDVWRIDGAVGYRFTPHIQLKVQYNLQHKDSGRRGYGHTLATQFTLRF